MHWLTGFRFWQFADDPLLHPPLLPTQNTDSNLTVKVKALGNKVLYLLENLIWQFVSLDTHTSGSLAPCSEESSTPGGWWKVIGLSSLKEDNPNLCIFDKELNTSSKTH